MTSPFMGHAGEAKAVSLAVDHQETRALSARTSARDLRVDVEVAGHHQAEMITVCRLPAQDFSGIFGRPDLPISGREFAETFPSYSATLLSLRPRVFP